MGQTVGSEWDVTDLIGGAGCYPTDDEHVAEEWR
jgi:hypothetical protein